MARPLTKKTKDGVLYTRPLAVEANIDDALTLDDDGLNQRLRVTAKSSRDYLRSECLVHLFREAHRANDERRRDAILRVLFGRCEAILKVHVAARLPNAAELREDILSEFGALLASDGDGEFADELDYYECRFNHAFRTLYLDSIDRELGVVNWNADLPDERDTGAPESDEDVFARLSESFRSPAAQCDAASLAELLKAINSLPPEQRDAVVLVHGLGYDEESDDPHKITAATLCKCTGRTIRNRLSRAAERLARFKEES